MGKKLYVGNLSYKVTEDDLKDLFKEFETVTEVNVVTDRATGRSRGFGFIELSSDDDADKAVESLNGKMFQDREVVVNEARPQKDRGPRKQSSLEWRKIDVLGVPEAKCFALEKKNNPKATYIMTVDIYNGYFCANWTIDATIDDLWQALDEVKSSIEKYVTALPSDSSYNLHMALTVNNVTKLYSIDLNQEQVLKLNLEAFKRILLEKGAESEGFIKMRLNLGDIVIIFENIPIFGNERNIGILAKANIADIIAHVFAKINNGIVSEQALQKTLKKFFAQEMA